MEEVKPDIRVVMPWTQSILYRTLPPTAALVLTIYVENALIGGKYGRSNLYGFVHRDWTSVSVLAMTLGCSEKAVRNSLNLLEERGLIDRWRQANYDPNAGNPYTVTIRPLITLMLRGGEIPAESTGTNRHMDKSAGYMDKSAGYMEESAGTFEAADSAGSSTILPSDRKGTNDSVAPSGSLRRRRRGEQG